MGPTFIYENGAFSQHSGPRYSIYEWQMNGYLAVSSKYSYS